MDVLQNVILIRLNAFSLSKLYHFMALNRGLFCFQGLTKYDTKKYTLEHLVSKFMLVIYGNIGSINIGVQRVNRD